ncbi:hypothetical protein SAG0121_04595 [Streptococcus agalactiae STIR-CD-07]|nr:hypothetical protein SaSA97_1763 [Streptococcus agalactiae]AUP33959.1 hypothetical protein SaSA343_1746 [Streptococcus agalactiae]EPU04906.1 hypothetical protein SAG0122_06355 [Streptococcus agalactiae STIR-CD-09]EPU06863.1 hypothetical protein SAG0123_09170 [Streptococcus agalactiae STIR-CD-13]EPW83852.1 hypothetical protein SAG0121_04595 [Streptococcus agalactiae STIR-CD-07]
MGKYQLDYKGQAQVQKFHEKHLLERMLIKNHV